MKSIDIKKIAMAGISIATAMLASSCIIEKRGSSVSLDDYGDEVHVSYPIEAFTELEGSGALTIKYTQGPTDSVRIVGPANWVQNITVRQDGELLRLGQKENIKWVGDKPDILVYLSSEDLKYVDLSGANDLEMDEPVHVNELSVELSGAADVDIKDLDVNEKFQMQVSGAGDVDIDKVDAPEVYVELSGAGDLDLAVHNAQNVKLDLSGAGAAALALTDCGDVLCDISGAAAVKLSGKANSLTIDKGGVASVNYGSLDVAKVEKH